MKAMRCLEIYPILTIGVEEAETVLLRAQQRLSVAATLELPKE
jgi:hypothetical protein